jgi:hypothetical protein
MSLPEYRINNMALNLRAVSRLAAEGSLELNPPYQRGDVWTHQQRVNLIKSLLLGIPIAALILNRRGSNRLWTENEGDPGDIYYAMIDGKQRTTTGILWFTNHLAVPAEWFRTEWVPLDHSDSTITHDSLTKPAQRFMGLNFTIPVAEARLPTLAAEAEVYGLVNGAGTPQTEEDLARARHIVVK